MFGDARQIPEATAMSSPLAPKAGPDSALVDRLRVAGCVYAEEEARLLTDAASTDAELAAMVDERLTSTPLEYVLGWAEFHGLMIVVTPGVFVPRRRTAFLAKEAIAVAPSRPVVVDLCCGSGAVGAAIVAALDGVDLYAVDIDPGAVRCARQNLDPRQVYQGDLYEPLPTRVRGHVDILVANPPYVPTAAVGLLPREARSHEPVRALDGGQDGLDIVRRVVASAAQWLAPGGHLLIETSEPQTAQLVDLAGLHGLTARVASSEELGASVVLATPTAR